LELGQHHYRRLLAAGGHSYGEINLLGALEVAGNDGPWDQPENLEKFNGVLRLTSGTAANGFALTGMAYQADWTASEHVPERAITNGEIGRYGVLSANDGGHTHRYSLSGNWTRTTAGGAGKANLYVIDYGLNLFSAPSGFISGAHGHRARRPHRGNRHRRAPRGPYAMDGLAAHQSRPAPRPDPRPGHRPGRPVQHGQRRQRRGRTEQPQARRRLR